MDNYDVGLKLSVMLAFAKTFPTQNPSLKLIFQTRRLKLYKYAAYSNYKTVFY